MDLPVCEEGARVSYDRDAFGSAYSSLEDEIIDALPKSDGQVYTPYTCTLFDIQADGTAATDIEHIVALAEAYDSGLVESQFRTFAGDIDNLTIADPTVNRSQKNPTLTRASGSHQKTAAIKGQLFPARSSKDG